MATAPEPVEQPADTAAPAQDAPAPFTARDMYGETERPVEAANEQAVEQQEEAQPELEPIARPQSWSNEEVERWQALPRETQEYISKRENEREAFVRSKAQEASRARDEVQQQARDAHAQQLQQHAQQLQQLVQLAGLPQEPDRRLLDSVDPEHHRLYMAQKLRYDDTVAQVATLQRSAEQARQQANDLQSHREREAIQADEAKVLERWPDWSDPSKRAERLAKLVPVAEELGYTAEMQAKADSFDLFALDKIAGWKERAGKYDALMKQKMEPVRAAKQPLPIGRAAPPSGGNRQPQDAAALLYPNDPPRQ